MDPCKLDRILEAQDSVYRRVWPESEKMDPRDACSQIHKALASLPALSKPSQAPFDDGLYFFYEIDEISAHGPAGRVVRIGNHPRSEQGLRRRLRQHYSGRKNGSVFRKLIGGALLRSNDPSHACLSPGPGLGHWEKQDLRVCCSCQPLEGSVSEYVAGSMYFRTIRVPVINERNRLEELLIATLARCPACRPSADWLGLQAYPQKVRDSGLWNSQYVDREPIDRPSLERFLELAHDSSFRFEG